MDVSHWVVDTMIFFVDRLKATLEKFMLIASCHYVSSFSDFGSLFHQSCETVHLTFTYIFSGCPLPQFLTSLSV